MKKLVYGTYNDNSDDNVTESDLNNIDKNDNIAITIKIRTIFITKDEFIYEYKRTVFGVII